MNMSKRVKNYDERSHQQRLRELDSQIEAYNKMLMVIKSIDKDLTDVESLDVWLNTKTGFKNTLMSASAMGVESEYKQVTELAKQSYEVSKLNVSDKAGQLVFTSEFLDSEADRFKTYYTNAEVKEIEQGEKVVKMINELPKLVRSAIFKNEIQQDFMFSPNSYILKKQMLEI